jgi:hypothetical protein
MNLVIDAGIMAEAYKGKGSPYIELIPCMPELLGGINSIRQEGGKIFFPQIFISYASEDVTRVRNTYKKLKAENLNPWMDRSNIDPGTHWDVEIQKALQNSGFFVVCLSRSSVAKEGYFKKEIDIALDLEKTGALKIFPVLLDDCPVPASLNFIQWTKRKDFNQVVNKIKSEIQKRELYKVCMDGYSSMDSEIVDDYIRSVGREFIESWYGRLFQQQALSHYGTNFEESLITHLKDQGIENPSVYIRIALALKSVLIFEQGETIDLATRAGLKVWNAKELKDHLWNLNR